MELAAQAMLQLLRLGEHAAAAACSSPAHPPAAASALAMHGELAGAVGCVCVHACMQGWDVLLEAYLAEFTRNDDVAVSDTWGLACSGCCAST